MRDSEDLPSTSPYPDLDRRRNRRDRQAAPPTTMSAVRRLLTGAQSESSTKSRLSKHRNSSAKNSPAKKPPPALPADTSRSSDANAPEVVPQVACANCANGGRGANDNQVPAIDVQISMLRELSARTVPENSDRLHAATAGDYHTFLRLFQLACDVQGIIGVLQSGEPAMAHLKAERLKAMGITMYGVHSTVTIISNGAGVLFVFQHESLSSLVYEGIQFDVSASEEVPIDLILKAVLETTPDSDLDDLKAILSSVKFGRMGDEGDGIEDLNAGGLDVPGVRLLRAEYYTTRTLCMMTKTDIYEQGFYRKYVHVDRLGTTFTSVREGETATLTKINVLPDALSSPVKGDSDMLGEDLFLIRRKGRKDRFRLSCAVSVNVWEEYETPEWFGYIHPPPNAETMRPADLGQLKERLEAYGVPDGLEVCRFVYHCLAHKPRNSAVKVDTLSGARGYFMYLKNFLKHGSTGTNSNHIIEGDELAVINDGIAYRVAAPQTELRHKSLFMSLLLADERERNGKNVPKRAVLRRMCSASEVVLSLCRDITYLNAEYDEDGGTLYSASAEEENIAEAWATCMALYVCDGYGCLEGCFNCAIEGRKGAIVDETAVFTNDVQVPVVFDKLYRKSSLAEELGGMSDARGATYPGAFISGRDQCNERTFLAGRSHRLRKTSLMRYLQTDLRLSSFSFYVQIEGLVAQSPTGVGPLRKISTIRDDAEGLEMRMAAKPRLLLQ